MARRFRFLVDELIVAAFVLAAGCSGRTPSSTLPLDPNGPSRISTLARFPVRPSFAPSSADRHPSRFRVSTFSRAEARNWSQLMQNVASSFAGSTNTNSRECSSYSEGRLFPTIEMAGEGTRLWPDYLRPLRAAMPASTPRSIAFSQTSASSWTASIAGSRIVSVVSTNVQ
jgi:hypothetical protein